MKNSILSPNLIPVMEYSHETAFGAAKLYVDIRWLSRLRRAWGHVIANPSLMQYGVGIEPILEVGYVNGRDFPSGNTDNFN